MKRPTWATVVGILGIIFACSGILGAGQEIIMPKMLEMQKVMIGEFQKSVEEQVEKEASNGNSNVDPAAKVPLAMFETMQSMWELPEWFGTWSIYSGLMKALVSAFYLYASISLLQMKKRAIGMFYWAAGSSILLCVLKGVVAISALSFMGIAMMFGGVFGALIDVVLIVVIATSNKEAFQQKLNVE